MTIKEFPIDSAEVEKVRKAWKARKADGSHSFITVYVDEDEDHDIITKEVFGYYSWAGIYGDSPESLRIFYGSDLTAGVHVRNASELSVFYTDSNDVSHSSPSGTVTVFVSENRSHQAGIINVTYENATPPIRLVGYYVLNI